MLHENGRLTNLENNFLSAGLFKATPIRKEIHSTIASSLVLTFDAYLLRRFFLRDGWWNGAVIHSALVQACSWACFKVHQDSYLLVPMVTSPRVLASRSIVVH
jgi:hypothetical protein